MLREFSKNVSTINLNVHKAVFVVMSNIKLKVRDVEVEFDGEANLSLDSIFELLEKMNEISSTQPSTNNSATGSSVGQVSGNGDDSAIEMSTNMIATKMGAKKGSELLLAAAGHLAIVMKQEKFTRDALHKAAKTASKFYKPSVAKNLTPYIQTLINDGYLNEPSVGVFSLTNEGDKAVRIAIGQ